MTRQFNSLATLSDAQLLQETERLAAGERRSTARLVAALIEVEGRRLYLGQGCSSLFNYCTQLLRLSEDAAYGRITAARTARRFPVVLDRLAEGMLTLTTIGLLAPHLTDENHQAVLDAACHRGKRQVEHQVAALRPLPPVAPTMRRLPAPKGKSGVTTPDPMPAQAEAAAPSPRPAIVKPTAPEQYKVQFTISAATHQKLRRAQDLLRHSIPAGDFSAILDRALDVLLERLEKTKLAASDRPRTSAPPTADSRRVPAAVKRAVWKRDAGRCAFVGARGRCTETGFLEFHHAVPFARGGEATVGNIELRCRAHNQHEATLLFGAAHTDCVRERRAAYAVQ